MMQLVPVTPLVSYVMGGWEEAKSRKPKDSEIARMVQILDEAMAAGANGWAAQRLPGNASVQRDYDGSLMISDIMSDEFYLALAKGMRKHSTRPHPVRAGLLHRRRRSGGIRARSDGLRRTALRKRPTGRWSSTRSPRRSPSRHLPRPARRGRPVQSKGVPLVGHAMTVRLNMRCCFSEKWTFFDDVDVWRDATMGTLEERKAKLTDRSGANR